MGVYCSMPMISATTMPIEKLRSRKRGELEQRRARGQRVDGEHGEEHARQHAFGDGLAANRTSRCAGRGRTAAGRGDGDRDEGEADVVERPGRPFSSSLRAAKARPAGRRMPSGRMRKNVQRQLMQSVTSPPKVGPRIGPITPPTPHIIRMKGCWLRWNEVSTMVWPIGKIGAPNAPCTTRSASSPSSDVDQAAQHRGGGEADDREDHQRAPAEPRRQPAGERRGDRGRDEVEGEHPGDLLLGRRQACP